MPIRLGASLLLAITAGFEARAAGRRPQVELVAVIKHKKQVHKVAFSPDGKVIATGTATSSSAPERTYLRLLDATTYKDRVRARTYWADVRAIVFSSDSKRVAVAASKREIIDVATGKVACRLARGLPICFVENGKAIATLAGGPGIQLLDSDTGKPVRTVAGRTAYRECAASPDGKTMVALTDDHELQLIRTDTWQPQTLRQLQWEPMLLFWSPDSRCFFVNGRPGRHPINAFIHEVAARKTVELATAGEHTGAFSPDGNTVVLCGPTLGTGPLDCRIHDTRTGKLQRTLSLHNGKAMCVAFSPDGRFMASGGHDRKLKIWRFAPAAQPQKGNPPAAARR